MNPDRPWIQPGFCHARRSRTEFGRNPNSISISLLLIAFYKYKGVYIFTSVLISIGVYPIYNSAARFAIRAMSPLYLKSVKINYDLRLNCDCKVAYVVTLQWPAI